MNRIFRKIVKTLSEIDDVRESPALEIISILKKKKALDFMKPIKFLLPNFGN